MRVSGSKEKVIHQTDVAVSKPISKVMSNAHLQAGRLTSCSCSFSHWNTISRAIKNFLREAYYSIHFWIHSGEETFSNYPVDFDEEEIARLFKEEVGSRSFKIENKEITYGTMKFKTVHAYGRFAIQLLEGDNADLKLFKSGIPIVIAGLDKQQAKALFSDLSNEFDFVLKKNTFILTELGSSDSVILLKRGQVIKNESVERQKFHYCIANSRDESISMFLEKKNISITGIQNPIMVTYLKNMISHEQNKLFLGKDTITVDMSFNNNKITEKLVQEGFKRTDRVKLEPLYTYMLS